MERANYHTHTTRCMHAEGSEREYIEHAIKGGIKILGFSDHSPMPYTDGFVSGIRMKMEELPGYIETLQKLREEYKDRIDIKIGFEAEYVPELFDSFMKIVEREPIEYLILGQHFVGTETPSRYSGRVHEERQWLKEYVDVVIEGLKTEKFVYLAHPDLIHYGGDDGYYVEQMTRLCEACKQMNIPLEINRLGLCEGRHYPTDLFWQQAAKVGNHIIIGYDAHQPYVMSDEDGYQACMRYAAKHGLTVDEGYRIR